MLQEIKKTVLELKPGEKGIIEKFTNPHIACKLIAMGVAPQSSIHMVRRSALGNTIYVKANGCQFAIRKQEAQCIRLS